MPARALLTAAVLLLLIVPGSSARALATTWTGTWDTEWGAMKLTQNGSRVAGTYPHDSGHIAGTLTGNKLKARWDEAPTRKGPNDAGAVELTMSANGKNLTGRWNYDGSPTSWSTDWNGSCSAGACLRNTSSGGGGGGGGGPGGGTTTTTTPGSGAPGAPPTATPTGTLPSTVSHSRAARSPTTRLWTSRRGRSCSSPMWAP